MTSLDWIIIAFYLVGMIALSIYIGRDQKDAADYYVGGRNVPWWALGISTMATQTSANSFIGIPAYVALAVGGGLAWLQYELAVPLAMIFILVFLLPFFRKLRLVTVYEYLQYRFGSGTRYFLSAVFLIARGVGTAAGVYAGSIVISVCLGISGHMAILLMGTFGIIYDTIGGIKMVICSDVIQMVLLFAGLISCIWCVAIAVGGWEPMLTSLSAERWRALQFTSGIGESSNGTPFWAFLLGGFFLYCSYYGVDQTQAQRALSSPSIEDTKRAMIFNGLARFPLTVLYLMLGIAGAAAYAHIPSIRSAVPLDRPDYLVPEIIMQLLPSGLRALLLASLLAASMSGLDSALNSLSAVTVEDFIKRKVNLNDRQLLRVGKITTAMWGVIISIFALFITKDTPVVVTINRIGSAFYGPILATFVMGVLSKRVNGRGIVTGVLAGVGLNIFFWLSNAPLHWMWWNLIGFFVTVLVAYPISFFSERPSLEVVQKYTLRGSGILSQQKGWIGAYMGLFSYFVFILSVTIALTLIAGAEGP